MNKIIIDNLWYEILDLFKPIVAGVSLLNKDISYDIGKRSNDIYPISGYLSFTKDLLNGDEIVISFFIIKRNNQFELESDICKEEKVLAIGPKIIMKEIDEKIINDWLMEFKHFLIENQLLLKNIVLKLD